jgi:hypothetical protein
MRARHPDMLIRLRHETCTRSDALLEATGAVPPELAGRPLSLGAYPAASQFSTALFEVTADAIILSVQPDTATGLVRHREAGFLFYPAEAAFWRSADRAWLKQVFAPTEPLDAAASMRNLAAIITRLRNRTDAPILIYNSSPLVPGEAVHCFQGLGETYSTRIRRFNLALTELSEQTGISIIDVDSVIARAGGDRLKLDAIHLLPEGHRLVAEEVVRVLDDLGVIQAVREQACVPA